MRLPRLATTILFGTLVAALVPLGLVGGPVVGRISKLVKADVHADNERAAHAMRDRLQEALTGPRAVLEQLAAMHSDGDEHLEEHLRAALSTNAHIDYLAALDQDGRVVRVAMRGEAPEEEFLGFDRSRQEVFVRARRTGAPAWSDAFYSLVHNRKSVSLVVPMSNGLLLANVPTDAFEKLIATHELPAGSSTLVVDQRGSLLFHPDPQLHEQRLSLRELEPVARAMKGEEGSAEFRWNGVDYLGSTALVDGTGWTVLVMRERGQAMDPVTRLNLAFATGAALALLLAAGLAALLARSLARPIARFAAETASIAEGSYELAPAAQPYRETAELSRSITSMAGQIRSREQELKESRERFMLLFNLNRDAILVHRLPEPGVPGPLVEANARARELLGLDAGRLGSCRMEELLSADSRARLPALLAGLHQARHTVAELELRDRDGGEIAVECLLQRFDHGGDPLLMWVARDLRQRRLAERQQAESERRHRFLIESIGAVPFSFDLTTGRIDYVGPQAERILGFPGEAWADFESLIAHLHPDQREPQLASIREAARRGSDYESLCRLIDPSGAERWVHLALSASREAGSSPKLVGLLRDVTATRAAEELLRRSEERLRALVEAMPVLVLAADGRGRIVYVNKECARVTGYATEELVDNPKPWELLFPDPNYRRWARSAVRLERGEYLGLELDLRAKDGTTRTIAWTNVSNQTPIPGWTTWAIGFDMTDRKLAEREVAELERRLFQSQKMEAIGTLAGGVAHDFNNVLGAVLGHAELLETAVPSDDELARDSVSEILKACQRARDLVEQILTFSRKREVDRVHCRLGEIVDETLGLLRASIPKTIGIAAEVAPASGAIEADPTQMQQVLVNLCTNAYHAMRATGGSISIDVRDVDVERALADSTPGLSEGAWVRLSVADTGCGMDEKVRARIFEPFFTTKPVGEGTGMGLAVVHGIVNAHGGAIRVSSEPGEGSTFEVYLPRGRQGEEHAMDDRTNAANPEGREQILYVDDEPAMAKVGGRLLESLGYAVHSAVGGEEAFDLFVRDLKRFDLVITDQTMPRMTGTQLAEKLLALRPSLPVIVCTGYSDGLDPEAARGLGLSAILKKPVAKKTLAEAVRAALDARGSGA